MDPSYPSEFGQEVQDLVYEEQKEERNFSSFVEDEQEQNMEVETPDHSMYQPLGGGTPPNEPGKDSTTESNNTELAQEKSEAPAGSSLVKESEGNDGEVWQEVFDIAEIEAVDEMNDLIFKVSSFLVQDRSLLSKWISGVQ